MSNKIIDIIYDIVSEKYYNHLTRNWGHHSDPNQFLDSLDPVVVLDNEEINSYMDKYNLSDDDYIEVMKRLWGVFVKRSVTFFENAEQDHADWIRFQDDPYKYYGVSRKDFLF